MDSFEGLVLEEQAALVDRDTERVELGGADDAVSSGQVRDEMAREERHGASVDGVGGDAAASIQGSRAERIAGDRQVTDAVELVNFRGERGA